MVEEQQKRQTARKLWIRDVLSGSYVKEEGMKPHHVLLPDNTHVARANILGVVVSASSEGMPAIVLDDGTGRITVRAFEPHAQMGRVAIGDAVLVVGRVRQFGNERYLLPEIVRKLSDLSWLDVRKAELGRGLPQSIQPSSQQSETSVMEDLVDESFGLAESVLGIIRGLDSGQGADVDAVIAKAASPGVEKTVDFLLRNGDVFEVSPGKLKILE